MLASARLTLKQHRFEVGVATIAAVLLGAAALVVDARLRAVNASSGCFESWLAGNPTSDCSTSVAAFASINESQANVVFAAMAILPFAVGLLGGVPIVGRELEARTAETAWSLSASRIAWLGRQLLPIVLSLGLAVTFASVAAGVLEATRQPWYCLLYTSPSPRD